MNYFIIVFPPFHLYNPNLKPLLLPSDSIQITSLSLIFISWLKSILISALRWFVNHLILLFWIYFIIWIAATNSSLRSLMNPPISILSYCPMSLWMSIPFRISISTFNWNSYKKSFPPFPIKIANHSRIQIQPKLAPLWTF